MKSLLTILTFLVLVTPSVGQQRGLSPVSSNDKAVPKNNSRAVVVGISDYANNQIINDLRYADKDAEEFAKYLMSKAGGNLPAENIKLLINEQATAGQFQAELNWLYDVSNPGDEAIIYFAGHGEADSRFSNGYLLCYDSPSAIYSVGNFSTDDLNQIILVLQDNKKIKVSLIVDACRAGQISNGKIYGPGITNERLSNQLRNEVRILSCQSNEFSQEGERFGGGRGVFSFYLTIGLYGMADEDHDGQVTLNELQHYLQVQVTRELTPAKQLPQVYGDGYSVISIVDENMVASITKKSSNAIMNFGLTDARSFEETVLNKNDTLILSYYQNFKNRIKEKIFLTPNDDCAEFYYSKLLAIAKIEKLHAFIKRNYVAALQDEAQTKINLYMDSNVKTITAMRKDKLNIYKNIPVLLNRAAEIIGPKDYRFKPFKSREYLFEGITMWNQNVNWHDIDTVKLIIQKLEQSIAFHKENPLANYFLSNIFAETKIRELKNRDSCFYYAQQAIQSADNWILPHAFLIHNLCRNFNEKVSPDIFNAAKRVDSTNVFFLKSMGNYHFYQREWEEALSYYDKAMQSDSLDPVLYINLGATYEEMKNLERAEFCYKESSRINSRQVNSYLFIGYLRFKQKKYSEAEQYYAIAYQNDPKKELVLAKQAMLYLEMNKMNELNEKCKELADINAEGWRLHYYQACVAATKGSVDEALMLLEKACFNGFVAKSQLENQKQLDIIRGMDQYKILILKYFTNYTAY